MRRFEHESCGRRRYAGQLPECVRAALNFRKGDSSSNAPQTATNQQTAVSGGGVATGVGGTTVVGSAGNTLNIGSLSTGGGGGSAARVANRRGASVNPVTGVPVAGGGNITITQTSLDADVANTAIRSANATAATAIVANTALASQFGANEMASETNLATVFSQAIAAFTNHPPTPAQLVTAPAAIPFTYPTGDAQTATDSASGDTPAAASAPAGTPASTGLTRAEIIGLAGIGVAVAIGIAVFALKKP